MEDQNKYMKALGYIALAALAFGAYKYFADKPKGVNGFLTDRRMPGKSLAASQVLNLLDKDHEYPIAVKYVVKEHTKGMSANKSKQFKRKLERELNKYI